MFKNSVTGKALLEGTETDADSLNWPKKVKWRHERDGFRGRLEECGLYIASDRKLGLMLKQVLRPFSAMFIVENGTEAVTTDQRLFNDRFLTGHNASERHFGSMCNMFPLLLDTKQETDPEFLADCIHVILHAWNIHKDLQDQEFYSYSPRQRHLTNAHLARYFVLPGARESDSPDIPQQMPTWEIMTNYWLYHQGSGI